MLWYWFFSSSHFSFLVSEDMEGTGVGVFILTCWVDWLKVSQTWDVDGEVFIFEK